MAKPSILTPTPMSNVQCTVPTYPPRVLTRNVQWRLSVFPPGGVHVEAPREQVVASGEVPPRACLGILVQQMLDADMANFEAVAKHELDNVGMATGHAGLEHPHHEPAQQVALLETPQGTLHLPQVAVRGKHVQHFAAVHQLFHVPWVRLLELLQSRHLVPGTFALGKHQFRGRFRLFRELATVVWGRFLVCSCHLGHRVAIAIATRIWVIGVGVGIRFGRFVPGS